MASAMPISDAGNNLEPLAPTGGSDASLPPIITQYWNIAMRRKYPMLGVLAACLAIGFIATLLMSPLYTAATNLEISREQKKITKVEGIEASDAGQDNEFYETQYALLRATTLADRVARNLGLARNDDFFAAHGAKLDAQEFGLGGGARLNATQRTKRDRLATQLLLKNVAIGPVRKSRLVEISYTSQSPELSTRIANTWAQQFIAATMDRQFDSTADARKFLEERLVTLKAKLEQSERDLVNYASNNQIVALSTQRDAAGKFSNERTLAAANVETLSDALNAAVNDRIAATSRLNSASENLPEAVTNSTIGELRKRRADLNADYAKLMVQFEPGYPPAQALNEQIRSLDAAIAREVSRFSAGRKQVYAEAVKRESDLRVKVDEQMRRLDSQQRAGIQYKIYQREVDTNRELYDALLQRFKEIGVAGVVGANNIAIIDPAERPDKPSSPNLPKNLLISLLLGLLAAGATALALDHIDEGIRNPADVNRFFELPLLGSVPIQTGDTLVEIADTKSHLVEAYFSIRSNLAFTTAHGLPRSFMVTSTRPAEGKSTTALALATVIGLTGKRVLLVDADMRSPSVHEYVGGTNKLGLSNLLSGQDNVAAMVQASRFKGVSILPAGPHPPSAAELLSNERLRSLIETLLTSYDHVILDSPPVLGLTDAPLIGRAVEGCVYVIEAEGVAIRGVRSALDRLRQVNIPIFGAVLSKFDLKTSGYGYGYGYGYGSDKEAASKE